MVEMGYDRFVLALAGAVILAALAGSLGGLEATAYAHPSARAVAPDIVRVYDRVTHGGASGTVPGDAALAGNGLRPGSAVAFLGTGTSPSSTPLYSSVARRTSTVGEDLLLAASPVTALDVHDDPPTLFDAMCPPPAAALGQGALARGAPGTTPQGLQRLYSRYLGGAGGDAVPPWSAAH